MMKTILITLLLLCGLAHATERERVPAKPAASVSQTQSQNQSLSASPSTYAPATNDSAFYALPATSLAGGALSSAMCTTSSYTHRSYVWGLFASADGQAKPDMECVTLVNRVEAMRAQPAPVQPVTILTSPPAAAPVACADAPKPAPGPAPGLAKRPQAPRAASVDTCAKRPA